MKLQKSLTLEHDLWNRIDWLRGDVSRSRYVEKIIQKQLMPIDKE